jgi:SAM-dependent methyltransferase
MSLHEDIRSDYDQKTPPTQHDGLAAEMYGHEFFANVDGPILNVAAGYTDLGNDLRGMGIHKEVISLDPLYSQNTFYRDEKPGRVVGTAQTIPYPDAAFSAVMCQFGMQHITDKESALREMVRVTRVAESRRDTKGTILLGPVFKPKQLRDAIVGSDAQLALVSGIQSPPEQVRHRAARPTLIIKKTADLTEERLDALIGAIEQTGALDTKRTLGEMASRLFGQSKQ